MIIYALFVNKHTDSIHYNKRDNDEYLCIAQL